MSKKTTDEQAGSSEPAEQRTAKSDMKSVSKPESDEAGDRTGASRRSEQDRQTAERPGDAPARQRRGVSGLIATLAFLVALAAAGFTAWQAYQLRQEGAALELEVARKLDDIDAIGNESRRLSSQARDVASDVEVRLGVLEARLAGMQNQRMALDTLYEELSLARDEWTLAEVEQILLVASQQLQLAGNVKAALIALEAADARLARSDRPQLTEVRRAITGDIERLKASPFVDVTGIGLKLERVIAAVDELPLAVETRPVERNAQPAATVPEGWRLVVAEVWDDLRSLVRIERVDSPETPPLAPDQTFFLRENLKLRLLGARLALLARDQVTYKADLAAAIDWSRRYFEVAAPSVASSVDTLNELANSDIQIDLPNVNASLNAVRSYRLVREPTLQ